VKAGCTRSCRVRLQWNRSMAGGLPRCPSIRHACQNQRADQRRRPRDRGEFARQAQNFGATELYHRGHGPDRGQ
jgi:hypothetical protein